MCSAQRPSPLAPVNSQGAWYQGVGQQHRWRVLPAADDDVERTGAADNGGHATRRLQARVLRGGAESSSTLSTVRSSTTWHRRRRSAMSANTPVPNKTKTEVLSTIVRSNTLRPVLSITDAVRVTRSDDPFRPLSSRLRDRDNAGRLQGIRPADLNPCPIGRAGRHRPGPGPPPCRPARAGRASGRPR